MRTLPYSRWSRGMAVALVASLLVAACGSASDASGAPSTTAGTPTSATSASNANRGCSNGAWPSIAINASLAMALPSAVGYFVWVDYGGWHLRFVNPGPEPADISGRVVASDRIANVNPFPPGTEGVTEHANEVTFAMSARVGVTGLDVNVGCTSTAVRFELNASGQPWPVETIFLGKEGKALSNPFVVERTKR